MCNAWNHSAGCTCGWGGDGHAGRSAGGWPTSFRLPATGMVRRPQRARVRAFDSYTIPNARCSVCGANVFFYQSSHGGRVFFDELGPPWPKHPCTDRPRGRTQASEAVVLSSDERRRGAVGLPGWRANGWRPIELVASGRQEEAFYVEWFEPDGEGPPIRAYTSERVSVAGPTVASVLPWDQSGRSMVSFVELDSGSRVQEIKVMRAAPAQRRFIREQLDRLVADALGVSAMELSPDAASRRLAALGEQMLRWETHLTAEEVAEYRKSYEAAQSSIFDAIAGARAVRERLIGQAAGLAASANKQQALGEFQELKRRWAIAPRVGRATEVKLRARFDSFEHSLLAAIRAEEEIERRLRAERALEARRQRKLQIIASMEALAASPSDDLRHQLDDLMKRWKSTGQLKKSIEDELRRRVTDAETSIRTALSKQEAAQRASMNHAAKAMLVVKAEALAESHNWTESEARFQDLAVRYRKMASLEDGREAPLWARFQHAYFLARDTEHRDAVREKIRIIGAAQLVGGAPADRGLHLFRQLRLQWDQAGSTMEEIGAALAAAFHRAWRAFLNGLNLSDLENAIAATERELAALAGVAQDQSTLLEIELEALWARASEVLDLSSAD